MDLNELQTHWNEFGKTDPLYAILTCEGKSGNRWDKEEFFASGKKEVADLLNYIKSLGLKVCLGKALDFGCGVGRLTQALADHFADVSGVDIAPSMIELANVYNRLDDRCHYYVNPNCHLRMFDDHTFDFIYSHITLQHMAPKYSQGYIQEFLRILAPDGLLAFQMPSAPIIVQQKDVRQQIRSFVPNKLLNFYRKLRYGGLRPVMQMYGVAESVIVKLLEENEASIRDIRHEPMAEAGWVSNLYVVQKRLGRDRSKAAEH